MVRFPVAVTLPHSKRSLRIAFGLLGRTNKAEYLGRKAGSCLVVRTASDGKSVTLVIACAPPPARLFFKNKKGKWIRGGTKETYGSADFSILENQPVRHVGP